MSDTSNHYIGKSDDMLHDEMERAMLDGCMRNLAAFVLALVVCGILTVCCGCSRKVSEDVAVRTTERSDTSVTTDRTVSAMEQSTAESSTNESLAGVLTRLVDDSLDMTLRVTEYGDDGQPKKVTEATLHRGKKDRTAAAVQTDCHNSQVENAERIETEIQHEAMAGSRIETQDVKRVVERRGWWALHWHHVLAAIASAVIVALAVWKRRRWLPIVVTWIRRFF